MKKVLFALGFVIFSIQTTLCNDVITIYYLNRIPYFYKTEAGEHKGLVMEPVIRVFKKAGIPYNLKELPVKRILSNLKENQPNICSIGWYKNPEREKFVQYSLPVYQNKSRIAITKHDNTLIPSGKTLDEVFKISGITLLINDGYSYGKFIDEKITAFKPKTYVCTIKNDQMLKAVFIGTNKYFFLSEEEADALIPGAGYQRSDFKYIHFSNVPTGLKRHIIFSKQVDDKIISRINKAIQEDQLIQNSLN